MTKFRPYVYFLSVKYNDKQEIVTDKIKFYLDERDQWEEQLNLVTTNEFAKQQFWKSVNEELNKNEQKN